VEQGEEGSQDKNGRGRERNKAKKAKPGNEAADSTYGGWVKMMIRFKPLVDESS